MSKRFKRCLVLVILGGSTMVLVAFLSRTTYVLDVDAIQGELYGRYAKELKVAPTSAEAVAKNAWIRKLLSDLVPSEQYRLNVVLGVVYWWSHDNGISAGSGRLGRLEVSSSRVVLRGVGGARVVAWKNEQRIVFPDLAVSGFWFPLILRKD